MPVTIKDIARTTGYASSTVCNVLNSQPSFKVPEATRRKIFEAAERLGYKPDFFARGLRRKRSYLVGVAGNLFPYEILCHQVRGIAAPLLKSGYQTYFADTGHLQAREAEVVQSLCHRCVEGLIIVWPQDTAGIRRLVPASVPCVLLCGAAVPGYSCIVLNRVGGVFRATRLLQELGHRHIGFLTESMEGSRLKREGHRRAMEERGAWDKSLVLQIPVAIGEIPAFVEAQAAYFRKVTAVLACDDHYAIGVMTGLQRLGRRVPQDCSVVGFDDVNLAAVVSPSLTTLRQPREDIGELASRLLNELMEGRPPRTVILEPELIVRESTGPCPRPTRRRP